MSMDAAVTLAVLVLSIGAIGVGVGCAVSPAWSAVVVGSILLGIVVVSRLRPGGKTE